MKKDKQKTRVLFLMEQTHKPYTMGSVFAYFPDEIYSRIDDQRRVCYAHIGQHSGCVEEYAINCKVATQQQYNELKIELESIGYNLDILDKHPETVEI